jgi:hypothetical protein
MSIDKRTVCAIAATALAVACGPEQESPPAMDDRGANTSSGSGGDPSRGGRSETGGSSGAGGASPSPWNKGGAASCHTLANLGDEVYATSSPAPVPEMTGGEIVDGTYVLTAAVIYGGADPEPWPVKQTILITEGGQKVELVGSIDGGPDVRTTVAQAPSGNDLNSIDVCPPQASPNRILYTATPNSLTVFIDQAESNLVLTFTRPDCVGPLENHFCAPNGFPFVQRAFAVTENCPGAECHPPNPTLTLPAPGTLCMSGMVPERGWHGLRLSLFPANQDGSEAVSPFDAEALGITRISFTIDSPPPGGILVDFTNLVPEDCTGPIFDCLVFGFTLPPITVPGTTTVPLTAFTQSDPASRNQAFDTSSLGGIAFGADEGAYDFCVEDFKLLDDAGNEVSPQRDAR